MKKVAAIIPTTPWTQQYLKVCVESLRKTVDWPIIVVSNGEPYYTLPDVHGITHRLYTKDQGQNNAVNIGFQKVDPTIDYVFVSNDDMYYAPNWADALEKLDSWPLVFSPNLVEPDNNHGSAPPFLKLGAGFTLDEFKPEVVDEFVRTHEHEEPETGFNLPLFIRRDVWQAIGGYDTAYDPWGSNGDTDLQAKFHLAGIQTMRIRDLLVYHFSNKSGTFEFEEHPERRELWQKNFDYFTDKWGFNRDTVPGCDVWYSKNILPEDDSVIKYRPEWKDKFREDS